MKTTMETQSLLDRARLALALVILNSHGSTCFAQGSLTPPGAPAPIMKTLAQIEPRTLIDSIPFVITNSGSYYLASSLVASAINQNGITILTGDVTVDLNGFALIGIPGSSNGIYASAITVSNLVIRNGTIRNWGQDGVAGARFNPLNSAEVRNSIFEKVLLSNNGHGLRTGSGCIVKDCVTTANADGIIAGDNSVVSGCTATRNSGLGIFSGSNSTIKECTASGNGTEGITAVYSSTVIACSAYNNGTKGIYGLGRNTIKDCTVVNNLVLGISVDSQSTIKDCTAVANSGTGIDAGFHSIVSQCTVSQNQADGIRVSGYCIVLENTCNGNSGAGNALHATGSGNRIESNNITFNNGIGLKVDAAGNLIIKNSAAQNTGANYSIAAGNSDARIIAGTTGFSTTNAWANFSF